MQLKIIFFLDKGVKKMECKNVENKMNYEEFKEQEKFCRENNKPDGCGCTGCPGENSICADNIRNILGKMVEELQPEMINEVRSGLTEFHYGEFDCEGTVSNITQHIVELFKRYNGSTRFFLMKKEHTAYVWEVLAWSLNKEDLLRDLDGLKNSEEWIVVEEEEFFGRLTEVV